MARLTTEQIQAITKEKGLKLINPHEYISLAADNLVFTCAQGHTFISSLKDVRALKGYNCPECEKQTVVSVKEPPVKTGYRVVGFDQATQNFGVSVYDDGKLVYYDVIRFVGSTEERLYKAFCFVDFVCQEWKPDYVVYEDIQLQGTNYTGYHTFKVLAELLGVVEAALEKNNMKCECVLNKVWQAQFNISGKDRMSQKQAVIKRVEEMFSIRVNDDIADAILIGKYGVRKMSSKAERLF